jgi:hypothetical protein
MRRCPGDYYGSMIRKSSGFDYYGNYVLGYLNPKLKKKRIRSKLQQIQPIGRYSIYAQNEGRLEGMLIDLSNTKVEEMEIFTLTQSGTILEQKVSEKAAVMLIGFKSKEAMRNFNSNHLANKQLYAKCSL